MSARRVRSRRRRKASRSHTGWTAMLCDPQAWDWWFYEVLREFEDDFLFSDLQYHGWLIP